MAATASMCPPPPALRASAPDPSLAVTQKHHARQLLGSSACAGSARDAPPSAIATRQRRIEGHARLVEGVGALVNVQALLVVAAGQAAWHVPGRVVHRRAQCILEAGERRRGVGVDGARVGCLP